MAKPGLAILFSLHGRVDRKTYALVGFSLMLFKYAVDAGVIFGFTGEFWTPLDYLSPLLGPRTTKLGALPAETHVLLGLWTLPFMWIGVTMTIRRVYDTGVSAWWGLLFFVPIVNYMQMLILCLRGSKEREQHVCAPSPAVVSAALSSALRAVFFSLLLGGLMFVFQIYGLRGYGAALFAGTPFMLGVIGGFIYNRPQRRSILGTVGVVTLSALIACAGLLLFVAEGLICIAMVLPLLIPVTILGGLVGRALAPVTIGAAPTALVLLIVPGISGLETGVRQPASYEVITAVEIEAPPQQVWSNVIAFSDLPEPSRFLFHLGVAYPMRARIDGHGVGAVRHCEFSTGAFVEPITHWDEPLRLSFDVIAQPQALDEMSPFRDLSPPHLDGYMRSVRGEFRLILLSGNRTRLEGSTWYELRLYPAAYWSLWSDAIVHRIHTRVLEHIKDNTETQTS